MHISCTVISHFYNEEYLLPWWLRHHTRLFTRGILINRGSTDQSSAICRRLAPHWELRDARNTTFDARDCDQEVMEIETRVRGWKIALNTTEFFCCRDMQVFLQALEAHGQMMYRVRGVVMVDDPQVPNPDPDPAQPLVTQRHHGYFEDEKDGYRAHSRFLHKHLHGAYHTGRHDTDHPHASFPRGALIKWFAFSPWNEAFRKRKLQIQQTISEQDRLRGFGWHHFVDAHTLEQRYRDATAKTEDLRQRPEYRRIFSKSTEPCLEPDRGFMEW